VLLLFNKKQNKLIQTGLIIMILKHNPYYILCISFP